MNIKISKPKQNNKTNKSNKKTGNKIEDSTCKEILR